MDFGRKRGIKDQPNTCALTVHCVASSSLELQKRFAKVKRKVVKLFAENHAEARLALLIAGAEQGDRHVPEN